VESRFSLNWNRGKPLVPAWKSNHGTPVVQGLGSTHAGTPEFSVAFMADVILWYIPCTA
jgi:hypothetical protein